MKKITLNLVKGLLSIVLFTTVSVLISTTGVQTVNAANAGGRYGLPQGPIGQAGQVSVGMVNEYLIGHGYTNIHNLVTTTSNDWKAQAVNSSGVEVTVIIKTQGNQIVGNNDAAL